MAIRLRKPDGGAWSLKDWVQGKPLGHPSHPMFVHFPVALYLAALVLDVMSRVTPNQGLVLTSTYLMIGGALGAMLASITGLVDWFGMIKGSSKRRLATQHMVLQLSAAAFFSVSFFLRYPERFASQAEITWIVLEAVGYAILVVGQYLGGVLVYERAMRVSTGGVRDEV